MIATVMCNGFIRVLYSYNYPDNKLIKNSVSIFLLSIALKMKVSCKILCRCSILSF